MGVLQHGIGLIVVAMRKEHVQRVMDIYLRSFTGTFLARLGRRSLHLMFVAFIVGTPREVSLVCINEENQVIGFVCGSSQRALFIRDFLRRHWLRIIPVVLSALVVDWRLVPELIWRCGPMLRAWRGASSGGIEGLPAASLMTIAVEEGSRRQGVGTALVLAFTSRMAKEGVRSLRLAVSKDNQSARRLYERLGWDLWPVASDQGAGVRYYVKDLNDPAFAD